jgi:Cu-processing system ATP-binding protein
MIRIQEISKSFGKLKVLNSISVSCEKGETISLIGPNSSGKTTLIKCLLGMVIPDSGKIFFDGKDVSGSWLYRDSIGYMPQIGRYPENMTIGEVFDMILDLRKKSEDETDRELIHSFGLDSILNKRMRTLSGGTRQKVSASLAFLFHPQVLILDEPTAGLDPVASETLKEKIRKEKDKGKLIFITSHILSDLDDLVTRVIYLQEGSVLFHKSISELRNDTGEEKLSRAIAAVMKKNEPAESLK